MIARTLGAWLVAAAALAATGSATAPSLLGLFPDTASLARVDPQTLERQTGASVATGPGGCARRGGGEACWTAPPWSLSPDRRRLALASNERDAARAVRLVDVARLRVVESIRLRGGPIGALAWLAPRRIVALQEDSGRQSVLVVDLDRRRVVARRSLGGSVVTLARAPSELLLLVAHPEAIGPARLVVVGSRGTARSVRLGRVPAGLKLLPDASAHAVDHRKPGLAVDPRGRRAYVVTPSLVVAVDLRTLSVTYHARGAAREPAARTKSSTGFFLRALWLDGVLAISGSDSRGSRTVPAGLALVDTRSWRTRTLDRGAWDVAAAGDLLLATGPAGLVGFGVDGAKRFALFEGRQAFVTETYGGRAYVLLVGEEPLRIVDLARGELVGTRGQLPILLDGVASSWWD